jgi:hypothetical protein
MLGLTNLHPRSGNKYTKGYSMCHLLAKVNISSELQLCDTFYSCYDMKKGLTLK